MPELLRCEHMIQAYAKKLIGDFDPVRWERRKNEDTGRYQAVAVVLCDTAGCEKESEVSPRWFEPDHTTLMEWDDEGGCETLDGCWVEPDGRCEHGFPSWLRWKGYI
ncbi:MAG: hypothetical protein EBS00_02105 [Verrucomicrobia bacterium]|nr:hypothetical protein [Verrucomicrobiota bacterium]